MCNTGFNEAPPHLSMTIRIRRFAQNPIIHPGLHSSIGDNVNGPALIRVPAWVEHPLGRYYLYFAHHDGDHIRLAYADALEGPWAIHEGGVLALRDALFTGHIASPDAYVDDQRREIRLYYHGSDTATGAGGEQHSRVACSIDGRDFSALPELLGRPYMRVFRWRGDHYALAMPGVIYRSRDGCSGFEEGPAIFPAGMRHNALVVDGDTLSVFYTNVGDCPERILLARVELTPDWRSWTPSAPVLVLEPERDYEGGHLPRVPSVRGEAHEAVCQLRDPALFRENGRTYLLYAVAGERGIAIAQIEGYEASALSGAAVDALRRQVE
jgi:hypothetical protein